ncbi:MAG: TlpA family protein disulfide reductase [Flavipsychrobacter sp.]
MAQTNSNNAIFYTKRITGLLLLLAMAAVFFISAISKLTDIEPFQWTFVGFGIGNMLWASVIAHLFIGFELLIGVFLLAHIYLKEVTYPVTIGFLAILTIYLVVLIIQQGNTGNCGCFGNWIYMNPLQAIWKNLAMIAACFVLMRIYPVKPYKGQEWIAAVLGMAAIVTTFIISPLNISNTPTVVNRPINLELLYEDAANKPAAELRTGKHIIAYMSLTCPHCRKAAYLLHVLKKQNPGIPMYLVLSGHPDNKEAFFKESHAEDLPFLLFKDIAAFQEMAGDSVPAIYWVNNGTIEKESTYLQLDPSDIKDWLRQ